MAYYLVEDFRGGIDLRRTTVSTKPGALRDINNGFVTVGGEIEQRRRFELQATLPADTHGIIGVGGEIWVHGLAAGVTLTLPFVYKQIVPNPALPAGATIVRILDADLYNRFLYMIVQFSDGTIRHFYNGVQITASNVSGSVAETHKDRVYIAQGDAYGVNILRFSLLGDPTNWIGTSAGFVDVTARDFGTADIIALETYYSDLAVFGIRSIQIWQMDPDLSKNQIIQVIGGLGVIGRNAHTRYGNGDILFLADTGIRSLKARDSSGAATQGDIGTPIDDLVKEMRRALVPGDLDKIQGIVDPGDGNIWFVFKNKALILAYYPVSDVSAWSRFELGFTAEYTTVCTNRVFFRDGANNVYVYGAKAAMGVRIDPTTSNLGPGAAEYDGTQMTVETPMFDFGHPGHFKTFTGLDLACDGVIHVDVNYDPNPRNPAWSQVVTVRDNTFGQGRVPLEGYSTHIGLRFRSVQGFARVGAIAIHYEQADAE